MVDGPVAVRALHINHDIETSLAVDPSLPEYPRHRVRTQRPTRHRAVSARARWPRRTCQARRTDGDGNAFGMLRSSRQHPVQFCGACRGLHLLNAAVASKCIPRKSTGAPSTDCLRDLSVDLNGAMRVPARRAKPSCIQFI
jgi:hypothetical protein